MTIVALHSLDLSKIKRTKSSEELTGIMQQYIRLDERMRAECQREGKPVPHVKAAPSS
jgi:hypothetical protein